MTRGTSSDVEPTRPIVTSMPATTSLPYRFQERVKGNHERQPRGVAKTKINRRKCLVLL